MHTAALISLHPQTKHQHINCHTGDSGTHQRWGRTVITIGEDDSLTARNCQGQGTRNKCVSGGRCTDDQNRVFKENSETKKQRQLTCFLCRQNLKSRMISQLRPSFSSTTAITAIQQDHLSVHSKSHYRRSASCLITVRMPRAPSHMPRIAL